MEMIIAIRNKEYLYTKKINRKICKIIEIDNIGEFALIERNYYFDRKKTEN